MDGAKNDKKLLTLETHKHEYKNYKIKQQQHWEFLAPEALYHCTKKHRGHVLDKQLDNTTEQNHGT